jgi:hypothetical protein
VANDFCEKPLATPKKLDFGIALDCPGAVAIVSCCMYGYTLSITGNALLLLILYRGLRNRMVAWYPLFYGYIGYVLAASAVQVYMALQHGVASRSYHYAFHLPSLLLPLLQMLILWNIYARVIGNTKNTWRTWIGSGILVAALSLVVAQKVFSMGGDFFYSYHAVMCFVQMLACVLVYRSTQRHPEVVLGRNLNGILLGISLVVGLQAVNLAHFLFKDVSFLVIGFFMQFIYFVALSVFAYTMWHFDPVRTVSPEHLQRLAKIGEDVERAIKTLVSPR